MSIICELRDKTKHAGITLVHEESEDVLVGSVFGIIKNISHPKTINKWIEDITNLSIQDSANWSFSFWERQPMPVGIQEGSTEVDVVLDSDDKLIFIEAKLGANASYGTAYDPSRNQLIRNLDIGYNRASTDGKRFALIFLTPDLSQPHIVDRIHKQKKSYPANPSIDPDLINQCQFWSSWSTLGNIIMDAFESDELNDTEKKFAIDLLAYLSHKRLWENKLNDNKLFYDDKLFRSLQKSDSSFVPYTTQRPESDQSWRLNTDWTESDLLDVLINLSYKQKALLKILAKNDGTMKQGGIYDGLQFLDRNHRILGRYKSQINAACKSRGKSPILSVGTGNRDQRIHEINPNLGGLRELIIEEAKKFFIPDAIIDE